MARKSVQQMANELYEDEQVRAAVLSEIDRIGTAKRIERGELTLPHPRDAKRWLEEKERIEQATQEDE